MKPTDTFKNCESEIRRINLYAFDGCANLKIFEWPANLRILFESAFRFCFSLKSYKLPENLYFIGETAFQQSFAPDYYEKDDSGKNVLGIISDLYIPGSVTTINAQAFHGYQGMDPGPPKKIHRLYLGSASDSMGVFDPSLMKSNAFENTEIDYVIIYCNGTEEYNSWNSESVTSYFPGLTHDADEGLVFPLQDEEIPQ